MRAKFVFESIKHLKGRSEEEINNKKKQLKKLIKKYLSFLDIEPDIENDSETQFTINIPEIHEEIIATILDEGDGPTIKFYYDTVAFNGISSNDEYTTELDGIPIKKFTKELWEKVVKDIAEYVGFDEETYQENQKRYAAWDAEISKKDSQWIKDNNYKHDKPHDKGSYYEGVWEYNWDEESGKWLNIQDRYLAMSKRGYDWDPKNKRFVKKEEE